MKLFITTFFFISLNVQAELITNCDSLNALNDKVNALSTEIINGSSENTASSSSIDVINIDLDNMGTVLDSSASTLTSSLQALPENSAAGDGSTLEENSVTLDAPLNGASGLSLTVAPTFTLSSGVSKILLYASKDQSFSEGKTISLFIADSSNMNSSWAQIAAFAGGAGKSVYLAVKSLDANNEQTRLSKKIKVVF